jgi:N-acetylglucosamine malate deacetylase 1
MNVLVIAAHPDDEILGCGGTLAKHVQQGDVVHLLILAEGATSRDFQRHRDQRQLELSALAQAAHQAGELLGVSSVTLHDFPDNRMDSCDLLDVTKIVEQAIEQHRPHLIYTHHGGDLNIDHRCVHQAVVTAARPLPNSSVNLILSFEVASSTEWQSYTSSPVFYLIGMWIFLPLLA